MSGAVLPLVCSPLNDTVPESIGISSQIAFRSVLLPCPFGPTNPTASPARRSNRKHGALCGSAHHARESSLENAVIVAYANHCSSENGMKFTGLITGGPGRPRSCAYWRQHRDIAGGRASANREPRTSVFTTGRPSALIPSLATNRRGSRAQHHYSDRYATLQRLTRDDPSNLEVYREYPLLEWDWCLRGKRRGHRRCS